ncbi:ZW10 interactor [Cricetulus griseus]|uniref:ZW10 interactor n=1 Tax=Cricetulus griseus TaxID=10029 RepID=G3H4L6_CRIGR|nr:ZW10 interactor [Cricetulus griseus]EGV92248.1 ZW10 interactor [Cricetulus griseus]
MEAAESGAAASSEEVLAEVAGILEPIGLQEEAELPARILEEFVRNSRKKDKLLCSQLQVVNFLQNFLAQEDTAQSPDTLVSEDTSRRKATEAKEQWKELKATYQHHVEAIKCALTQAIPQVEEAQRKCLELQKAYEHLQAKKRVVAEKREAAQKKWQLHQKHLQCLAELSAEVKELQVRTQQKLDRSNQELEILKQQAVREQDKLQRNQTYLQLLYTLQNKPLVPEAKAKDRDITRTALPSESL